MKTFLVLGLGSIALLAGSAIAQTAPQPVSPPKPRRALDQFDLINVRPLANAGIRVDLETYKLLGPVMKYAAEIERDYDSVVIKREREVDYFAYYERLKQRTMSVYRSITIVKTQVGSAPVLTMLSENQLAVKDIHETLFLMPGGDNAKYRGRLVEFYEKYGIAEPEPWTDGSRLAARKTMIAAMLAKMNANFGKLTVQ